MLKSQLTMLHIYYVVCTAYILSLCIHTATGQGMIVIARVLYSALVCAGMQRVQAAGTQIHIVQCMDYVWLRDLHRRARSPGGTASDRTGKTLAVTYSFLWM